MERRHKRFEAIKAAKGICVRFSTDNAPNITRLAEIIDIGMAGLAFRYTSRTHHTEGLSKFTVLTCNGRSAAKVALPCRVVYDQDCKLTSNGRACIASMRRCGVEFGNLSKGQVRQIKNFIRDHTLDNISDYDNMKEGFRNQAALAAPGAAG